MPSPRWPEPASSSPSNGESSLTGAPASLRVIRSGQVAFDPRTVSRGTDDLLSGLHDRRGRRATGHTPSARAGCSDPTRAYAALRVARHGVGCNHHRPADLLDTDPAHQSLLARNDLDDR